MRVLATLGLAVLVLAFAAGAQAHKPSDSYLTITQPAQGTELNAQWDIALRDLEQAIGIDGNGDGQITWGELRARRQAIPAYAFSRLSVEGIGRGDRAACALQPGDLLFDEHVDGGYAVLRFKVDCPLRAAELRVRYALLFDIDPNHRGLLEVRSGQTDQAFVVASAQRDVTISLTSVDRLGQFVAFLDEGVWHIWKGYDHILFLLSLLLPAVVVYVHGRWQPRNSFRATMVDVLKIVTAFTVAHSITLSLAVNGLVQLPSRWVESAIAATVFLGALNNLYPLVRRHLWVVAFAFGLIHGLGFASVLADLGLHGWNLVIALVGFNCGVELGQFCIVLCFIPLAYFLRATTFYRRAFMPAGAAVIGAIALYWFAVRINGGSLQ